MDVVDLIHSLSTSHEQDPFLFNMAALDEAGPSRKRIATYGKAVRKRQQGHDAFKVMAEFETQPAASRATPTITEADSINNLRPTSRTSATIEMSHRESNSDESAATPKKRKKTVDPNHASKRTTHKQAIERRPSADVATKDAFEKHQDLAENDLTRQAYRQRRPLKLKPKAPSPTKSRKLAMPARYISEGQSMPTMGLLVDGTEASLDVEVIWPKPDIISIHPAVKSVTNHSSNVIQNQEHFHLANRKALPPTPSSKTRLSTPKKSTPPENRGGSAGSPRSVVTILSPHDMKIWDELLGDNISNERERSDSESPLNKGRYFEKRHEASFYKHELPRRRLIDSLAKQSTESREGILPDVEDCDSASLISGLSSQSRGRQMVRSEDLAVDVTASQKMNTIGLSIGVEQNSQTSGPKFTYSRQRSMLAEHDLNEGIGFDLTLREPLNASKSSARRGSIPILLPLPTLNGIGEAHDESAGGAIRTIHELRQAGAESRFKDEVEDLLDRIGTPEHQISERRSALMDLARKMTDKVFFSKFLSHGIDQRLFLRLGQEQDLISGFMLISLLIVVLDSGATPVTVAQLQQQGITRLLIRLMGVNTSIVTVAMDKVYNMSKSAHAILSEQHASFLSLRVWDGIRPPSISPRTASLRCLELIVRQTREASHSEDIISKDLTGKLFAVLQVRCKGKPSTVEDCNSRLALSTLESHSLYPSMNLEEHLPIIKDVLEITLKEDSENPVVAPLLRLVLNATDNSSSASNLFASSKFLHLMCYAIVEKFRVLSAFVAKDPQPLVNHLVLMLIVLINTIELSHYSHHCFQTLHEKSIDDLALIFIEYDEKSFEAKSVEESQLNVAGGYLAVFLGFLSLNPEIGNRIAMLQKTKTLRPLIACIDEFISHHKRVDDLLKNETDYKPQAGLTDRLQRLVGRLKGDESIL